MDVVEDSIIALIRVHIKAHGVDVAKVGIETKDIPSRRDYRIENGETYWGTGEWEASRMAGLARAHAVHSIMPGGGTFLILYPGSLRKAIRASPSARGLARAELELLLRAHSFTVFFKPRNAAVPERVIKRYDELPGYFQQKMEKHAPHPIDVEAMIDEMERIESRIRDLLPPVNKDTTRLFRSILGVMDGGTGIDPGNDAVAKDAAAYLLISQFIYYSMLSNRNPARYVAMEPARFSTKTDIEAILEAASRAGHVPLFAPDILAYIPETELDSIKAMIGALLFLSPGAINKELLGRLFHKLIPLAYRREVAAFYTTSASAELLAHLAIDHVDARIIDPACGSGALLLASYQRLCALHERARRGKAAGPAGNWRACITGTDIMPFSAHLASITFAIQRLEPSDSPPFQVALVDSTRLEKHAELVGLQGHTPFKIEGIDLVIMNPPFTRQELINNLPGKKERCASVEEYKDLAIANILARTGTRYEGILNKKQALSSYFMVLADKILDDGGCIAAVLPATILRTEYNQNLRAFLLANYSLRYIVARNDALNFSDDTTLKEILFILRKQPPLDGHVVSYITVDELGDGIAAEILAREDDAPADGKFHRYKGFSIQKRLQQDLDASNLYGPISLGSIDLQETWSRVESSPLLRPLRTFERILPRSGRRVITREGAASRAFAKLPQMAIVTEPETKALFTFSRIEGDAIHFCCKQRAHVIDKRDTFAYVRNARNRTLSLDALDEFVIWSISDNDLFQEIDDCDIVKIRRAIATIATAKQPIQRGKTYTIEEIDAGFKDFHDELAGMPGKVIVSIFNKIASGHQFEQFQATWTNYLADKLCYLGTVDALHVEAPNTYFFAYFAGETSRVFSSIFLNVPCLSKEQARINVLWLNSALNMIQLFHDRNPTGWFKVKQYILEGLRIIDVDKLDKDSVTALEATFDNISREPFPCLWQQFFTNIPGRMIDGGLKREIMHAFSLDEPAYTSIRSSPCNGRLAIDKAIMRIFYPSKAGADLDASLHVIYRELLKEIITEKNNLTRSKLDPLESGNEEGGGHETRAGATGDDD